MVLYFSSYVPVTFFLNLCRKRTIAHHTAPHPSAPHRTTPYRTPLRRTASHRTADQLAVLFRRKILAVRSANGLFLPARLSRFTQ